MKSVKEEFLVRKKKSIYLDIQIILGMEGTEEMSVVVPGRQLKYVEHRLGLEISQMHKKTNSWMHIKIIKRTFKKKNPIS